MTITSREDQALLDAYHAGDPEAFAEIVASYRAGLLSHAQRRLHDRDAARDALQETFLRAYRAIDRFGGDQLLGAWLHRIMHNVCNDEATRRQRETLLLQRVGVPMAEHNDDVVIVDSSVEAALASLPANYRETLVLRAIDDLSFRELAARTGVTEENARARFHRARTMFRNIFDGSAAVLMPIAAFVSKPLSRFRGGNSLSGQTAVAQPVVSPQVTSFLASSPGTVHVLNEIAQPERISTLAKVAFTIAAAVPVVAVATPSSAPSAPPAVQVVQAADPATSADTPSDTNGSTQANGSTWTGQLPAATIAGPDAALAIASTTSSTSTTSTTVASNATSLHSSVPPPTSSDSDNTDSSNTDATSGTTTANDPGTATAGSTAPVDAPSPHGPNSGHVTGGLESDESSMALVYRGTVTLTVGSDSVPGWLGCSVSKASRRNMDSTPPGEMRCWFTADDGSFDLTMTAQHVGSDDYSKGGEYTGTWQVQDGNAQPMPGDGAATIDIQLQDDHSAVDMWLDPRTS